jgi:hypothetical protein
MEGLKFSEGGSMKTFYVKTSAVVGKRGAKWGEQFVVVADDAGKAGAKALAVAHPGAMVTSTVEVESVLRVRAGS